MSLLMDSVRLLRIGESPNENETNLIKLDKSRWTCNKSALNTTLKVKYFNWINVTFVKSHFGGDKFGYVAHKRKRNHINKHQLFYVDQLGFQVNINQCKYHDRTQLMDNQSRVINAGPKRVKPCIYCSDTTQLIN